MNIKSFKDVFGHDLTIRELVDGYFEDTKTGSIKAFDGKLEVHPPYQRNFVYGREKQEAVIDTILSKAPLSVMYWAVSNDGGYELLDGQQRTISICKFAEDDFSAKIRIADKEVTKTCSMMSGDIQKAFYDYPLLIFICEGTEEEKLAWFRRINIAGVPLTEQEMRNAIFNGPWVTDAKRYFSQKKGLGYSSEGLVSNGHIYGDYLSVVSGQKLVEDAWINISTEKNRSIERQALLEIVLTWACDAYNRKFGRKITIDDYMTAHQNDLDAKDLWRYYEDVMEWVKNTFPTYRSEMKGVNWGILYNKYHDITPDNADDMANIVFQNAADEISNRKGVYEAVLAKDIKFIHARAFDKKDTKWAYNKQAGICPYCHKHFEENEMQGDHIKPWSKGGITERDNLQMLCVDCNGKKSGYDTQFVPWDGKDYEPFDLAKWDMYTSN